MRANQITIINDRRSALVYEGTPDLDALTLAKGAHDSRGDGVCLMEAVAWYAGKTHTDRPRCVSPVLGAYGRFLNDVLPDGSRQLLKPYIPLLPGTAGDGRDVTRGYMALDWLTRTWLPVWLDLAAVPEAAGLRGHHRVDSLPQAESIGAIVRRAQVKATAAGDADWDAAWDAGAAARAAAGDAGAAARAAARAAAWDAGAADWDAGAAAWDAAWDAGAAARNAAVAVLAPVVAALQDSAITLYAQLITGEWPS